MKEIGADVIEKSDGFIIKGNTKLKSGKIDTFNDHRIAMTFHIASIVSGKDIVVNNKECVNISFPNFYKTLENILR